MTPLKPSNGSQLVWWLMGILAVIISSLFVGHIKYVYAKFGEQDTKISQIQVSVGRIEENVSWLVEKQRGESKNG
jgi:hypothetical protein